ARLLPRVARQLQGATARVRGRGRRAPAHRHGEDREGGAPARRRRASRGLSAALGAQGSAAKSTSEPTMARYASSSSGLATASERVLGLVEEHVRAEARGVAQVRAPRGRLLHAEGEAVAADDDPVRLPLGAGRRREREQDEGGGHGPPHAQRAGSHTGNVTCSVSRSKTTRTRMPKVISAGVARTM